MTDGVYHDRSNGIRFSISDLSPPTARILPTIYQDRCGISLYDAQYQNSNKVPIPEAVIREVIGALLRFKRTCQDFGVLDDQVRIVATEATRNAINNEEFQEQIQSETGWRMELLAKEEEGRVGAMGIASSFQSIKGLVLDLGGGSVQITWMVAENGNVQISKKGSVSFPYGAAALMMLLGEAGTEGQDGLRGELVGKFEQAIRDLEIPQSLKDTAGDEGGFTLHLSGGGFRGWGYILMSQHAIQPYPIPIINGFLVPRSAFLPQTTSVPDSDSTFRISSRRASQVPAITFLIQVLTEALPSISTVRFAQGGVREGLLFSQLSPTVRGEHPLITATLPYAPPSPIALTHILRSAIPDSTIFPDHPASFVSKSFLTSTINLLNTHSSLPKDIRAAAALRSTTTGLLASAHGVIHEDRALLALVLCERWGGEISPTDAEFPQKLQELVGPEASWWAKYVGRAAQGVGEIFPAGLVREDDEQGTLKIELTRGASTKEKSREKEILRVNIEVLREGISGPVRTMKEGLVKVGKKKNWIGGKGGYGLQIEVNVTGHYDDVGISKDDD